MEGTGLPKQPGFQHYGCDSAWNEMDYFDFWPPNIPATAASDIALFRITISAVKFEFWCFIKSKVIINDFFCQSVILHIVMICLVNQGPSPSHGESAEMDNRYFSLGCYVMVLCLHTANDGGRNVNRNALEFIWLFIFPACKQSHKISSIILFTKNETIVYV